MAGNALANEMHSGTNSGLAKKKTASGTSTSSTDTTYNSDDWASTSESSSQSSGSSESESFTGLPDWAQDLIKLMTTGDSELLAGYKKSLANLAKGDEYADEYAKSSDKAWARNIAGTVTKQVNSAAGQAAGAGLGSSSISKSWVKDIASAAQTAGLEQNEKSNQWAATQKMTNLKDTASAQKDYASLISELLGRTSTSTSKASSKSQSTSKSSSYSPYTGLSFTSV